MTVGERIRQVRESINMTQKQLSDIMGISFVTISQWENGKRKPKYETLQKIASALGVSISDLLDIKPVPEKEVYFGEKKLKTTVGGDAVEQDAFTNFLYEIGFKFYIDFTRLDGHDDKDADVWIFEDTRENKFYIASTNDLDKLRDTILSYSKFQVYELFKKLTPINKSEIGNSKFPKVSSNGKSQK